MPNRMNPEDFQNIVYKCCGLLVFTKWGLVHTMRYNNEIKENLISACAQNCRECGYFLGGVVSLANEEFYKIISCKDESEVKDGLPQILS